MNDECQHCIDITTGFCSLCDEKLRPSLIERIETLERQLSKDSIADSVLSHLYLTEVEDALAKLLGEVIGKGVSPIRMAIELVDGLKKEGFRFRKVI